MIIITCIKHCNNYNKILYNWSLTFNTLKAVWAGREAPHFADIYRYDTNTRKFMTITSYKHYQVLHVYHNANANNI